LKIIVIDGGYWWFKSSSNLKFNLTKFGIEKFDDLKKIFKFKRDNFVLFYKKYKIKKINYNFFINGKRVTKNKILEILENEGV
jgi:hypothetical protein